MFNPLQRSVNQELFEKHLFNQCSLCKKYKRFLFQKESHHQIMSTLFTLDKDEWDTKEEEYSGMLKANLSG